GGDEILHLDGCAPSRRTRQDCVRQLLECRGAQQQNIADFWKGGLPRHVAVGRDRSKQREREKRSPYRSHEQADFGPGKVHSTSERKIEEGAVSAIAPAEARVAVVYPRLAMRSDTRLGSCMRRLPRERRPGRMKISVPTPNAAAA